MEISHNKPMSKSSPWTQDKKTPSGKKTYDVLSIQRENGNGTKILGKSDMIISKKETKRKAKKGTDL